MSPTDWLMFVVALMLGTLGSFAVVAAPLLVWVAGKEHGEGSREAPGFRGAMLIWLVLTVVGVVMAIASVWIGSRLPAEAWA